MTAWMPIFRPKTPVRALSFNSYQVAFRKRRFTAREISPHDVGASIEASADGRAFQLSSGRYPGGSYYFSAAVLFIISAAILMGFVALFPVRLPPIEFLIPMLGFPIFITAYAGWLLYRFTQQTVDIRLLLAPDGTCLATTLDLYGSKFVYNVGPPPNLTPPSSAEAPARVVFQFRPEGSTTALRPEIIWGRIMRSFVNDPVDLASDDFATWRAMHDYLGTGTITIEDAENGLI